jgi:DNA (cytosine-5)-methyltransferase 1
MLSLWYCGIIITDMKHKVLDLFSGIGGFSLGLQNTGGFETVAFCEIEPFCHKVLKKHWQDVPIYNDIKELGYDTLQADGIEPTVITGGFPCQDISDANPYRDKTGGIKGSRSGLWSEFARLIKEIKPKWAIIENVASLRSKGLALVLQNLSEIGYNAEWHIISACSIGSIHRRERIFILAYPNSERLQGHSKEMGGFSQVCTQAQISSMRSRTRKKEWLPITQPSGMDDGVPNRAHRLRGLGNAVVPQIPQFLGDCILNFEKENI